MPKRVRTVFQDWPRFMDAAKSRTSRLVLHASTPEHSSVYVLSIEISKLTVVEKLAQWSTLMSSSCLRAVHRVKGLVQKQANGPGQVHPWRTIGIESRVVPQHGQNIDDHEAEACQGNLSGN